jgi:hypothetical protein
MNSTSLFKSKDHLFFFFADKKALYLSYETGDSQLLIGVILCQVLVHRFLVGLFSNKSARNHTTFLREQKSAGAKMQRKMLLSETVAQGQF